MKRFALVLALLWPELIFAADGVLEINQACAESLGCFPGDLGRLPVTISQPGSYRLTSNVSVPSGLGEDVLRVVSSDVTVDLNGFTISGAATGSDAGVRITSDNVEVRNGTIRSAGYGIELEGRLPPAAPLDGTRLRGLRILDNRINGIYAHQAANTQIDGCTVRGSVVGLNLVGSETLIVDSTAKANGQGLALFNSPTALRGSVFSSNTMSDLTIFGISPLLELGPNQCGSDTTCP